MLNEIYMDYGNLHDIDKSHDFNNFLEIFQLILILEVRRNVNDKVRYLFNTVSSFSILNEQ